MKTYRVVRVAPNGFDVEVEAKGHETDGRLLFFYGDNRNVVATFNDWSYVILEE